MGGVGIALFIYNFAAKSTFNKNKTMKQQKKQNYVAPAIEMVEVEGLQLMDVSGGAEVKTQKYVEQDEAEWEE